MGVVLTLALSFFTQPKIASNFDEPVVIEQSHVVDESLEFDKVVSND